MRKERLRERAQYMCPLIEIMEIEAGRPFAVSHVTTINPQVEIDDWGSSDNEVSFD